MSDEKKPVKVRLAEKWAKTPGSYIGRFGESEESGLIAAYLAGFERAKALCLDFTVRYVDERANTPDKPSKHMAEIGEGI